MEKDNTKPEKQEFYFNFTVAGNDQSLVKFLETVQSKPNMTGLLGQAFGVLLAMSFGWNEKDEIGITSFKIGKKNPSLPEEDKKVEN